MNTLKMPLLVTGVFVLTCFFPVIQILILTFDGGLLAMVNMLLFQDKPERVDAVNWTVNFSFSILFLILFLRTLSVVREVIFSILAFIFLFCFIFFLNGDIFSQSAPYFLPNLIISLVSGLIICATAILKNMMRRAKYG